MKTICMLLLLLASIEASNAQSMELFFNRLSIKNGLPEDVINSCLQDKEGYIWAGTQAGLVRYDGYSARVYKFDQDDPNHRSIFSIYQDRFGELWVGTWMDGLYHYDRATDTFTHYRHDNKDTGSISAGMIAAMHDDLNGNLWMIVSDPDYKGRYINLFDTKKKQFKHFGSLEKGNHYFNASDYTSLLEDSKGRIWVSTNNGIFEYATSPDKFIPHFASANSLEQKKFGQLTQDARDPRLIWMNVFDTKSGKGEGVCRYNTADNTIKTYHHIPGDTTTLGSDSVFIIQNQAQGRLWLGTFKGLSLFEPASDRFINYAVKEKHDNPYYNSMFIMSEENAGNFWCGNQNKLFRFDTKTRTISTYQPDEKDPAALKDNSYSTLLIDRSGSLWVGTAFQGLNWINQTRAKFTVYNDNPLHRHFFPGGGNTSFAEAKDGTFWVWSSNGLFHWNPSTDSFVVIKAMTHQAEDFAWRFSAVLVDKKGVVWCSTFGKGLISYNPGTGKTRNFRNNEKDSNSLSDDRITSLCEDDDNLWVGTMGGGLCSFNQRTNSFRRYPFIDNRLNTPNKNAVDDRVIFDIYKDREGIIWVGTNLGGLNRFNRESGTFTSYQNQLPGFMTITNMFEDSKGNFWVGTHVGGLFVFNRKTNIAQKFTEKDGMLYDGPLSINEDGAGNLWITSARGISILNIQTKKFSQFGTINGLPEEPENNLNFFKGSNGKFLMPCNNGFVSFDPAQLKPDTALPVIHIESVEITRQQTLGIKQADSFIYRYGKNKIDLQYNENRITFNYVGIQYQNAALNQYSYKLDGYDKDWIHAGTQRNITYNNLNPGTYLFHVKAANSSGVWNPNDDTISIVIHPPWWLAWWAYFLWAAIAGSLFYVWYRNRINQLKEKQAAQIKIMVAAQEGERKRISRDLHDDVGTKLSALKLFLSSLQEKAGNTNNEEIKTLAGSSQQFITEVMQDVRQLLLNLSPAVLEEFGYAIAVEGVVNKINETKQIHFNLVMFGMKNRLKKEYELALYRLTQELINNVLKHAEAKNVSLQIGQRDEKIILMIEDNGKGFDVNAHKDGYGLHNLEARTALMNGTMTIDSQPGKGTSVLIEIPYNFN